MKTLRICIFLLSMMFTSFAWAYDFEKDGIYYNILSEQDKTVEVASFNENYVKSKNGEVVIPSELNGYSVVGICDCAFQWCFSLKSITIPKNILHIGNEVFWGCDSISSIKVDKENPVYDSRDNCNAIIETASNRLVYVCSNTIIPNGVTSIGKSAFYWTGIQSIEFPNSLACIEDFAFCTTKIKTISIPDNVSEICKGAFAWCDSLVSVNLPSNLKTLGDRAFEHCVKLTSVNIPNGVTEISDSVFQNCSKLREVIMPNTVTSIGKCAFSGCSKLENVNIPSKTTIINDYAFCNCKALSTIAIPNGVSTIGRSAFNGCLGLTSIELPNSVTSIGNSAFSGCSGLTSIELPDSVTYIGESAFRGCDGLNTVSIPEKVTIVGEKAFYSCYELSSVVIPKSVEQIGKQAFYNCIEMTDIYCYLNQPIEIKRNVFPKNTEITIHVLKGKKEVFEQAEIWGDYTIVDDLEPEDYTSVRAVASEKPNCTDVYTLDGDKVDGKNLRRGIYIKNGKKVMVR